MHALGTCVQIRIACEHMRAGMRIGPYAPVCACAHAPACKIARARACIGISRIAYHNLATRVRTQPSMPQKHARTGTHTPARTQVVGSDPDAEVGFGSASDAGPIGLGGDEVGSDSESEDVPQSLRIRFYGRKSATAAIDLPPINPDRRFDEVTLPPADPRSLDLLDFHYDLGIGSAALSPGTHTRARTQETSGGDDDGTPIVDVDAIPIVATFGCDTMHKHS